MKPKIVNLKQFAKRYFKNHYPLIKYKKLKDGLNGVADTKKRVIYLNINQTGGFGCAVGEVTYIPKTKVKLSAWERYFAALLHEIAHFKIKFHEPSKKFERIKRKIIREFYPKLEKESLDDIAYNAADYLSEWELVKFRGWLGKHSTENHIKVEEWAIKEFKRQRKSINKIDLKR